MSGFDGGLKQTSISDEHTTLESARRLVEVEKNPQILFNLESSDVSTVPDIALIQCFHGIEVSRIKATVSAIEFNLQMTRRPSTWIFIECQKRKSDAVFGWLSNFGIKYRFVKMASENEGIFLKTPLWNIGSSMCSESRLCFLDSDVVMCDSNWIEKADSEFRDHDVLSLASHQYYEADEKCRLMKTIGYRWATEHKVDNGHCGFTLGLTRDAYNAIGGFDASLILDDIQFYHTLCGDRVFKSFNRWLLDDSGHSPGIDLRLGYVDTVSCHVWHNGGKDRYEGIIGLLKFAGVKSCSEVIEYDKGNPMSLPAWKGDSRSRAIRKTLIKYNEFCSELDNQDKSFDFIDEYTTNMIELCGSPDGKHHPLFVCTVVKSGFGTSISDILKFRDMVEDRLMKYNPVVLVFSDAKVDSEVDGLNIVELMDYDYENEFNQCLRKDLKWPKNAVAYFIPFGLSEFSNVVWIPESTVWNKDGTVLTKVS